MQTCYRIEHGGTGKGPYSSLEDGSLAYQIIEEKTGFDIWGDYINGDNLHPSPLQDKGLGDVWADLGFREDWYFCFESKESLMSWFSDNPEVYEILDDLGFKIVTYKADIVRGDKQAIFRKNEAEFIRKDIPSLAFLT